MTRRAGRGRTTPIGDGADEVLFEGDITDYWSPAVVRHWVLHIPELTPTARHLYLMLRAMLTSSPRGLRRMTIDQLCYLLTEQGEKPVGNSTVRKALKLLDDKGLVTNPDGERLVTSTGKGGIQNTARRYKVNDLPPDDFTGWSNTWQKLDAYREDWREVPVVPPTHRKTEDGIVRSISSDRSEPASKDKSPGDFVRSISSKPGSISSDARSMASTDETLTSENGPLIQGHDQFSLSSAEAMAPPEPSVPQTAGTGEREKPAAPKDTPAPATPTASGAREIGDAWAEARAKAGLSVPPRGAAAVARSAAALLAEGEPFELLIAAAADMGRQERVLTKLDQHLEYFEPPVAAAVPKPRAAEPSFCGECDLGWVDRPIPNDPHGRTRSAKCPCTRAGHTSAA
ncbi:hypothetical protein ACIRST_38425 [Kitasatospora sp. NPDC101447]|uniref:hypothetical protein n=1 Tax=Kitasatospora sp. NPDC101447 TaxID=3364102 RepID=UPI0037FDE210